MCTGWVCILWIQVTLGVKSWSWLWFTVRFPLIFMEPGFFSILSHYSYLPIICNLVANKRLHQVKILSCWSPYDYEMRGCPRRDYLGGKVRGWKSHLYEETLPVCVRTGCRTHCILPHWRAKLSAQDVGKDHFQLDW